MSTALNTKARIAVTAAAAAGLVMFLAPAASAAAAPSSTGTRAQAAACATALSSASDDAYNASWEVHVAGQDWQGDARAAQAQLRDPNCASFAGLIQVRTATADSLIAKAVGLAEAGNAAAADASFESAGETTQSAWGDIRLIAIG